MADNITTNPGNGGAIVGADDIVGVWYQRVKLIFGADGANDGDVDNLNPLPVGFNTVKDGSGTVYAPLVDADGHQQVDVLTGAGTAYTEDVATANPIVGSAIMMERDDALGALTPVEGDWASLRCTANGALWVTLDGAIPAGSNAIGKLAANSGVDIGDVDVLTMPATAAEGGALPSVFAVVAGDDGTDTHPLQLDASGFLKTVLQTGSAAFGKLAANSGVDIGDVDVLTLPGVAGDIAHDAGDSGNPVKIGAFAVDAEPAAVVDADRANLICDLVGKLITLPYANPEQFVSGHASDATGNEIQCIAAGAEGVRTYLTTIIVANSHATTSGTVAINDGTGNTVMTIPIPAKGGATITLPTPLQGTAATAWFFDVSAAITTVTVTMVGYQGI